MCAQQSLHYGTTMLSWHDPQGQDHSHHTPKGLALGNNACKDSRANTPCPFTLAASVQNPVRHALHTDWKHFSNLIMSHVSGTVPLIKIIVIPPSKQ